MTRGWTLRINYISTLSNDGCLHTRTPLPVAFQVYREIRMATIVYYEEPYSLPWYPALTPQPALHQYYFDPEVDIVQFTCNSDLHSWYCHRKGFHNFKFYVNFVGEDLSIIRAAEVTRF